MAGPHTITLIEGDGIGPEVTGAAVEVIGAAGVDIHWEKTLVGAAAMRELGTLLPQAALASIRKNRVALKGPITTPLGEGYPSINVKLRKDLGLFACVRPVKSIPGLKSLYDDVDLVVIRENTEDLYAGKEHEVVPGVIESLKIITREASLRIAQFAFQYAQRHGRKKISVFHKANIMKLSDGLFLECCEEVASRYPEIEYTELIVDNACALLVTHPQQFDVLLMENLYGDIISDLCAGLVGGIGVVPGANIGEECVVFEAVHGSWPQGAGKNIANPMGLILSAVLMLDQLGEEAAAHRIEKALTAVIREGKVLTRDLGGSASTTEFTREIIGHLD